MSELDTDALRIGTWVVDTAISLWLDHSATPVHGTAALETRVPSLMRRRRLKRDFEQIADTIAGWLIFDASSQAGLSEHAFPRQLSDAAHALLYVSREHADHLRKWRDPVLLASLICNEVSMTMTYGIILASCVALREVVTRIRTDGDARVPENLAEIPDFVQASLRAISRENLSSPRDESGLMYNRLVIEKMGLSQQLNSLFVKPRLRFLAQDGEGRSVQLETALASSRRKGRVRASRNTQS